MNRRGFFATVAAVMAAPRAVRLVAPAPDFMMHAGTWRLQDGHGLKPVRIEGLRAWLPESPAGRLETLVSFAEDGIITGDDFARLMPLA